MLHARSQFTVILVGALIAWLLPCAQTHARAKNDLGFNIGAGAGFTDNVRGSRTGFAKESSVYFSGELGASYARRLTFGDFSLEAGATGSFYTHDDRWNQIFGVVSGELIVPISNRLRWEIRDQFRPSPVDFTDVDTARTNQTQLNRASTLLEFVLPLRGRWNSKIRGKFARLDIIDIDNIFAGIEPDRYEASGEFLIERQFSQRWSLGVSTYFGRTMFINTNPLFVDTTGYGGSLEASYSIRKTTRFFGSVGIGRLTSSRFKANNLLWSLGVEWQIFKRLKLKVEGKRAHTVTLTGANAVVSTVSSELKYTVNNRLSATLAGVWYQTRALSLTPGKDQVFHVSPGLEYLMGRNYKASLNYAYTRNGGDSRPNSDFTRNSVFLGLSASF